MTKKRVTEKRLGELLVEWGTLSPRQLEDALAVCKKRQGALIGEVIVELGLATEEDIMKVLIAQYKFPYISLESCDADPSVTALIPEKIARQYHVLPLDKVSSVLTVAMANPLNVKALDEIRVLTGCDISIIISTPTEIKKNIDRCYRTY